jgi:hypothetical protein
MTRFLRLCCLLLTFAVTSGGTLAFLHHQSSRTHNLDRSSIEISTGSTTHGMRVVLTRTQHAT